MRRPISRSMLAGLLVFAACGEVASPSDSADSDQPSDIDAALIDAVPGPPDAEWPPAVTVSVLAPDEINANCPSGEFVVTLAGPSAAAVDLAIALPDGGSTFPSIDGAHTLDGEGHLVLTTYPSTAVQPAMTLDATVTDAFDRVSTDSGIAFVFAEGPVCVAT